MFPVEKIRADFPILQRKVNGKPLVYFDNAATSQTPKVVIDAIVNYYSNYNANIHRGVHTLSQEATDLYEQARITLQKHFNAKHAYEIIFTSGTTHSINMVASGFSSMLKKGDEIIVSALEHHSNIVPWQMLCEKTGAELKVIPMNEEGSLVMSEYDKLLSENTKLVFCNHISNALGTINPIEEIIKKAHQVGAAVLIDGAQMAAHIPVKLSDHKNPNRNIDAFVFSGHKTYVPGAPGVVVCRKDILLAIEPEEVGGGMVEDVFVDNYLIKDYFPDREEAGTPNIPGAIGLATAIQILDRIGMDVIYEEEEILVNAALKRMLENPDMVIYGETDVYKCTRAGSISFNIKGMHHGLTAAVLNDYFNIAVRNECFCAHPYVKELILDDMLDAIEDMNQDEIESKYKLLAGMVRASFGIYNKMEDVDTLINALSEIANGKEKFSQLYHVDESGNYVHKTFTMELENNFSIPDILDKYLNSI